MSQTVLALVVAMDRQDIISNRGTCPGTLKSSVF